MVRRKKIVPPVYPAALGAAVALYGASYARFSSLVVCILLLLALVTFCAFRIIRQFTPHNTVISVILLFSACFFAGIGSGSLAFLRIQDENRFPVTLASVQDIHSVEGFLAQDPAPYGPRVYRARFTLVSCERSDGASFSADGDCMLSIPAALVREALPGGIRVSKAIAVNYSKGLHLKVRGSFARNRRSVNEAEVFIVDGEGQSPASALGWHAPFDRARAGMRLSLVRILYDWRGAGGFLLALIAGSRDYLDQGLAEDFRLSGLSHVLALSGTHLSLVGLLAIRTGRRVGGKRFSVYLALLAMFAFVWFAGASPSLSRALIFAVLMAAVKTLGFEAKVLPLLGATSLLQMLLDPASTVSLAFQLSVAALWGILTFGEYILDLTERWIPRRLCFGVSASAGAQLMTAPVIAFSIGVLAPSGIIASCIVSPLSSVYLVAGSALLFLAALIPPLAGFFGSTLDALYRAIAYCAHGFARFPVVEVQVLPAIIAASIIPIAVGLALLWLSAGSRIRRSPDGGFARL